MAKMSMGISTVTFQDCTRFYITEYTLLDIVRYLHNRGIEIGDKTLKECIIEAGGIVESHTNG